MSCKFRKAAYVATALAWCMVAASQLSAQSLEARASSMISTNPRYIAIGDFNGDGNLDVAAVAYYNGAVAVLLGNGNGTFKPAVYYPINLELDWIISIDLRGNGILDLAVATLGNGVDVLLGNGDGTFGSPITYATVANPFFIAAGDFTNNGHPGIVALTQGSEQCGCIEVLPGRGDGTLGFPILTSYGPDGATVLTAGRFNAGANMDLVVTTASGFKRLFGEGERAVPVEYQLCHRLGADVHRDREPAQ